MERLIIVSIFLGLDSYVVGTYNHTINGVESLQRLSSNVPE